MLHYDPRTVLSWTGFAAALLPFAAGWLVVPGALLGLAVLAARPRGRADAGFAALALSSIVLVLLEVGMIAAGEAGRAIERYDMYLIPLAAIAFFAYVERGAPWLRLYVALALAGAATAWLMPFPGRAGSAFSFDSPTFSMYAQLATWFGNANAATLFAGDPLPRRDRARAAASSPQARPGRGRRGNDRPPPAQRASRVRRRPRADARHLAPAGGRSRRTGSTAAGLGPADYLQLPGGSAHYGWLLEAWNRDFRHAIQMGLPGSYDGYASYSARIDRDGRLLVGGRRPEAGILVVNDVATAIEIEGSRVVARPRDGLTAYRLPRLPTSALWRRGSASTGGRPRSSRSRSGRGADSRRGTTGSSSRSLAPSLQGM